MTGPRFVPAKKDAFAVERRARSRRNARGFSLLELIVVLAVTVVLTGLLLPALSHVRENVNRVISSSNLRQIGLAITMYDRDNFGHLPYSYMLAEEQNPQELMVAHLEQPDQWDGLGLLFEQRYLESLEVFYCPSHKGEHRVERYEFDWAFPDEKTIYTNYHYGGHVSWDGTKRRRLDQGDNIVLATDGLRTELDFNHETGMNILRGDGSVRWREDGQNVAQMLPASAASAAPAQLYQYIWNTIEKSAD